ncbi:MAG: PRC-barrel domain-containing protein [Tatlockia sp.]|nr:PRC-barrel domain-containing protein [Tatlockia sp.]
MEHHNIVSSEDIIGVKVENPEGENLGKIEALMLDKLSGKVSYVVLSFGGFLGMGDKLFALPWHIFDYNPRTETFVISMDKEKLKNSPGFDKDHWPDMSSSGWTRKLNDYYGPSRDRH